MKSIAQFRASIDVSFNYLHILVKQVLNIPGSVN